jgi:predicted protein tyrosine phosphatase
MEIRIASYPAASLLLEQEPRQWHALVILDTGQRPTGFVGEHARSHLYLRFDDIEQPQIGKEPPTRLMIERGLTYARGKDKLLVSCRAGRGRSVSMAYVIACRELGVDRALELLDPTRHRPNRLVIALGDSALANPDALDRFDAWRRQWNHVQLSDYHPEWERAFDLLVAQGASNRITCD